VPISRAFEIGELNLGTEEIATFLTNAIFIIRRFGTYERKYPDCHFPARGQT